MPGYSLYGSGCSKGMGLLLMRKAGSRPILSFKGAKAMFPQQIEQSKALYSRFSRSGRCSNLAKPFSDLPKKGMRPLAYPAGQHCPAAVFLLVPARGRAGLEGNRGQGEFCRVVRDEQRGFAGGCLFYDRIGFKKRGLVQPLKRLVE